MKSKLLKNCILLATIICLRCLSATAQINVEKAFAYYYSRDYKMGMQKIYNLTGYDDFLDLPRIDEILYCGILCCEEYSKELQLQRDIRDENGWKNITAQQQDVWNVEVEFMEYLDVICDKNLKIAKDIKAKHHYLALKIRYVSILSGATEDKKFEREAKSLCKQYIKEILPNLQNGSLDVGEVLEGYNIVMRHYAENNDIKAALNCMKDYIEPWFLISVVRSTSLDKPVKLTLMRQYKALLNLLNYGLEAEFSPSHDYISSVMDLNIKAKNMSFVLNGNRMYESHLGDGWRDIQKSLSESSVAIELCNAKGTDQHVFAFVIDKYCKYPRLEYCGHSYWAGRDLLGFKHLLIRDGIKDYQNIYYSPTEEMAFIETGQNKSLYRLHSLSELLMPTIETTSSPLIYTFADINYTLGDSTIYNQSSYKGAERLTLKLRGAKEELRLLRNTVPPSRLYVFDLDSATKDAFKSLSNKDFDILHVSTHAYYDEDKSRTDSNTDLISSISGKSILDNCGIKLSGYNDDIVSGCITATEISSLDLSKVNIVLLDACETGTGDIRGGDLYSLAEAFHTAGVRCVLSTTSEIEDKDASNVFTAFFTEVMRGNSYHDAFYKAIMASTSPSKYILWE